MKTLTKYLFPIVFIIITVTFGCRKNDIAPENYFETKINEVSKDFFVDEASMNKGITIIAANEITDVSRKTIIITINADEVGTYKQTFDYKTGVSISQCGLTYKIITKQTEDTPTFFMSYEGEVELSEIDMKNGHITGTYNFVLHSVPEDSKPYRISGRFIRTSFRSF